MLPGRLLSVLRCMLPEQRCLYNTTLLHQHELKTISWQYFVSVSALMPDYVCMSLLVPFLSSCMTQLS